jgi:hypothetical protein
MRAVAGYIDKSGMVVELDPKISRAKRRLENFINNQNLGVEKLDDFMLKSDLVALMAEIVQAEREKRFGKQAQFDEVEFELV